MDMSKIKDLFLKFCLSAASVAVALILCEFFVGAFIPQAVMYPRVRLSEKYYHDLYPGEKMLHEMPGRWKFIYTINEYGCRGKAVPVKEKYDKKNIVILGDSFAFGQGVSDGEEFPEVMASGLKRGYDVINLSVGGYGLTQEIRKYYDLGALYKPEIVVIVFCSNDPSDNFIKRVAYVKDGKILFRDMKRSHSFIKSRLSHSVLQKSQLFNLVLNNLFRKKDIANMAPKELVGTNKMSGEDAARFEDSSKEEFYNELLDAFVKDLKRKRAGVIFISVNEELGVYPGIEKKVRQLASGGYLAYIDIMPWMKGLDDKGSPEGHAWGKLSHEVIGKKLTEYIKRHYK